VHSNAVLSNATESVPVTVVHRQPRRKVTLP
jgi:hypothetical protein